MMWATLALSGWFVFGCSSAQAPLPPAPTGTQVTFDPVSSSPQLPTPTDLIRDANTGLLKIPVDDNATPAQQDFNAYLRTLNGYPTSAVAQARFTGEIDPNTVNDTSVLVYDITDGGVTQVTGLNFFVTKTIENNQAISVLNIANPKGWSRGRTFAIYLLGGENGLRDVGNNPIQASTFFQLAARSEPLCDWKPSLQLNSQSGLCENPGEGVAASGCCVRTVSGDLLNAARRRVREQRGGNLPQAESLAAAEQKEARSLGSKLEVLRQGYNQLLGVATLAGFSRENVVMVWHFSTTSMTEISFDPTTGVIPYPNNLLLNSETGKVALPASAEESATQKALREGLNTLDGFSTTGSYYAVYQGEIDPESVRLGESVLVLDLKTGQPSTNWKIEVNAEAKAIVATPTRPLQEKNTYAIVLVSKNKPGDLAPSSGLKDSQGRRVAAAPFMMLLRSPHTLVQGSASTISTVDDATAQAAEAARQAHASLFQALDQQSLSRTDIVAAWTFTTQSITQPLVQLRALPWSVLAQVDQNKPQWGGIFDPTLTGFPPGAPKDALGGWVPQGTFTSWMALDEQGTGALMPDPTKGSAQSIDFLMTIPKGQAPQEGWPVVLFQHGLTRAKSDMLAVANTLAKVGMATIAFDTVYHGARSRCTQDAHCASGTCDTKKGACSDGKLADSSQDGVPDASGAYFLNTANPFGTRDNFRQHVIDASAFLRGIALQASLGIKDSQGTGGVVRLNPKQVYLVGHSLGAILGALVLATDPLPTRGVLATPGAPLVSIILTAPRFREVREQLFASYNVKEGTLDSLRLVSTLHWILDPADAANIATYTKAGGLPDAVKQGSTIPSKDVLVMLAGQDQTIPSVLGQSLATWMGLSEADIKNATYSQQGHSFLLQPDPANTTPATAAAQTQMATFLRTGQVCTPSTQTGSCQ